MPDRTTVMQLAFINDHFGINPAFMMGLAAAASHLPLVPVVNASNPPPSLISTTSDFMCNGIPGKMEDFCKNYQPRDWANGALQITQEALAMVISAAPHVFGWTSGPIFASRHWYLTRPVEMAAYHEPLVTMEAWRSITVAASLANVLHTASAALAGFRASSDGSSEASDVMRKWGAEFRDRDFDLATKVCSAVDGAQNVIDFAIHWEDVTAFIRDLYSPKPVAPLWRSNIDWGKVVNETGVAFKFLAARRVRIDPSLDPQGRTEFVSLRYDWRLLLAVVRSFLPPREPLIGPSVAGLIHMYGPAVPLPIGEWASNIAEYPSPWCSTAGGSEDMCHRGPDDSSSSSETKQTDAETESGSTRPAGIGFAIAAAVCAVSAAVN